MFLDYKDENIDIVFNMIKRGEQSRYNIKESDF